MGRYVHDPQIFVVMEGCRRTTDKDRESDYVIPVMMEFKNYHYNPEPGYDEMRLRSASPIGILVPLKKCRYYDMSLIGLDVEWFNFRHMQEVFPQPILEAPDVLETAKGLLQPGQKIPALSSGSTTYPGSPGYFHRPKSSD